MLISVVSLSIVLGIPSLGFGSASSSAHEKHIIGWIETVKFLPENFQLSAKIDTGADNSSLNVTDLKEYLNGEKEWIRFTIPLGEDQSIVLERPIKRYVRIKRKGASSLKRPVVHFDLCIGTLFKHDVPVNLADRSGFKYPMLIGRSFLKGSAIVDSELTHTQQPSCL